MNIRQKLTGKAVLFDGTNYQEVIDTFNMKELLERHFNCSDDNLLSTYAEDGRCNNDCILIFGTLGEYGRVPKGSYIIKIDGTYLAMLPENFNRFYEEIPDEQ